jgi:hypothetical protein
VQILAPIAACGAAATVVSDPLQSAEICHGFANSPSGQTDQGGQPAHDGACAICCIAQANASVDTPRQTTFEVLYRLTTRVAGRRARKRTGSTTTVRPDATSVSCRSYRKRDSAARAHCLQQRAAFAPERDMQIGELATLYHRYSCSAACRDGASARRKG